MIHKENCGHNLGGGLGHHALLVHLTGEVCGEYSRGRGSGTRAATWTGKVLILLLFLLFFEKFRATFYSPLTFTDIVLARGQY